MKTRSKLNLKLSEQAQRVLTKFVADPHQAIAVLKDEKAVTVQVWRVRGLGYMVTYHGEVVELNREPAVFKSTLKVLPTLRNMGAEGYGEVFADHEVWDKMDRARRGLVADLNQIDLFDDKGPIKGGE